MEGGNAICSRGRKTEEVEEEEGRRRKEGRVEEEAAGSGLGLA